MKNSNQNKLVFDFITEHGSVTNLEAFQNLGVTRLANNICDLRKSGVAISDTWESKPNRYGKLCRYKRYFLTDDGRVVKA